ncbi:MAG: MetQ/NlpA family ABC transporter substrate-binding protein [Lachnospiraceae bacterium]|nr:MetQ/NlpA family ABC transporter substrate-binding protein [Lachnospiraceae bacterium]
MKKRVVSLLLALTLTGALISGCSGASSAVSSSTEAEETEEEAAGESEGVESEEADAEEADVEEAEENSELEPLIVGATVSPHAEILEYIRDDLAEAGYDLQIVEYNDYVLPNTALEAGDLDANYFQHVLYLENFNEENGTHLVAAVSVHFEPMAIYAGKTSSLEELQEKATVAVPNDTTNEARALLLLEANGLITLDPEAGLTATVLDITDNPLNLQITELEAAQIPRSIEDVDIAVINGNYALEAGLTETIAQESSESEAAASYGNVIAVREGDENSAKTQALVDALLTDKVRDYITDTYEGAVLPMF